MCLLLVFCIVILPLVASVSPTSEEMMKTVMNVPSADDTLIFAQIMFRHGNRALTDFGTYANDPYRYSSYLPYNKGDLIKRGMVATYRLGLELRQRYDKFLGETYNSHLVGAIASTASRNQESLQCVYAGMFPPNEDERFIDDLEWRPISYDILPADKDDIFTVFNCPDYTNIQSNITNQTVLEMLDYLQIHTGEPINSYYGIYRILETVRLQEYWNKPQPNWVHKIYPEPLISAGRQIYYDILEKRIEYGAAGFYKRITKNIMDKLNGNLSPPRRKMILYAGHDQNLVFALGGIKAYNGLEPTLASYIAYELHYINHTFGIKVYFQNYDSVIPVGTNILGYGEFCPLKDFLDGVQWLTESRKKFCEL